MINQLSQSAPSSVALYKLSGAAWPEQGEGGPGFSLLLHQYSWTGIYPCKLVWLLLRPVSKMPGITVSPLLIFLSEDLLNWNTFPLPVPLTISPCSTGINNYFFPQHNNNILQMPIRELHPHLGGELSCAHALHEPVLAARTAMLHCGCALASGKWFLIQL